LTYKSQVALFLAKAKELLQQNRYILVPREKNMKALARLGWNESRLMDFLMGLSTDNYSSGPEEDRDCPPEEVWVFGHEIDGAEYYIKLKIRLEAEELLCISFHEAERPLNTLFEGGMRYDEVLSYV